MFEGSQYQWQQHLFYSQLRFSSVETENVGFVTIFGMEYIYYRLYIIILFIRYSLYWGTGAINPHITTKLMNMFSQAYVDKTFWFLRVMYPTDNFSAFWSLSATNIFCHLLFKATIFHCIDPQAKDWYKQRHFVALEITRHGIRMI